MLIALANACPFFKNISSINMESIISSYPLNNQIYDSMYDESIAVFFQLAGFWRWAGGLENH